MTTTELLAAHQVLALDKIRFLDGKAGVLMGMGSGKTRVALLAAEERRCNRVLVVLPLSVTSVWEREARLVGFSLPVVDLTLHDGVAARTRALARIGRNPALVLVNYESYWREPLRAAILRWGPDAVILDEAHRVRHRGSRQSRFAHTLGQRELLLKLALTGTPVTNGLQDIWSIWRFLNPFVFGRYPDFEARYMIMGGFHDKQIKGYRNVPEVRAKIAATSFQWDGSTFETPRDVPITVHLTQKTRAVYEELRKKAIVEVTNAAGESRAVVARIVLTLLLRLQQIACGFARDVGEEIVELSTEKADACIDLIGDAVAQHERVVVFARFLHDLDVLRRKMPKGIRVATLTGATKPQERKDIREDFDRGRYDVLLAQIKVAGLGIDLSSATAAIFYSVGFSLDEFLQAKGRLTGALRQQHAVTFYHCLAEGTVDQKVYKALSDKKKLAVAATDLKYMLDLFES